jgi:drug/metabolite transporter (DMT)-like permease
MHRDSQPSNPKSSLPGTVMGIFAMLFWSTTVAFGRRMTEDLGIWTATAAAFILAGIASCLFWSLRYGGPRPLLWYRPAYLWGGGGMFTLYIVCFYGSIGMAPGRQQVLEVGVLNYLWPALLLIFSVPLLGVRARPTLWLGIAVSMGGALLALNQRGQLSWSSWMENFSACPVPYMMALIGAFAWALYSALARRFGPEEGVGAQPLFVLGTGLVLLMLGAFSREDPHWTTEALLILAYTVIFPVTLAYAFWDYAMRRGRLVLLASLSYLIPIVSTGFSAVFLGLNPGVMIWAACAMVIVGTVVCKLSVDA